MKNSPNKGFRIHTLTSTLTPLLYINAYIFTMYVIHIHIVRVYIKIYTHWYIDIHIRIDTYSHIHTHLFKRSIYIHTCVHTHTHILDIYILLKKTAGTDYRYVQQQQPEKQQHEFIQTYTHNVYRLIIYCYACIVCR